MSIKVKRTHFGNTLGHNLLVLVFENVLVPVMWVQPFLHFCHDFLLQRGLQLLKNRVTLKTCSLNSVDGKARKML